MCGINIAIKNYRCRHFEALHKVDGPLPYPAARLNLSERQVRLVKILPARFSKPIECELLTVDLDHIPTYYTISYTWGDSSITRLISVNGHTFIVTRNLESALRRIRLRDEAILFWIDMICIDQTSLEERTHQVNLMCDIYSRAENVVLWLGEFSNTARGKDTPRVRYIRDKEVSQSSIRHDCNCPITVVPCSNADSLHQELTKLEANLAARAINQLCEDKHLESVFGIVADWHRGFDALVKFMYLGWWQRMWTIQETILPRKMIFQLGSMYMRWDVLVKAAEMFDKHYERRCCSTGFVNVQNLWHLSTKMADVRAIDRLRQPGNCPPLIELLDRFRDRKSSDPKDKVFAILGIISTQPSALKADYSLSAEEAYRKAFMYALHTADNLNLLVQATEVDRKHNLPTWMPDWSADVDRDAQSFLLRGIRGYRASLATRSAFILRDAQNILAVKGMVFDTIVKRARYPDRDMSTTTAYYNYLRGILRSSTRSYIGGGDMLSAIKALTDFDITARANGQDILFNRQEAHIGFQPPGSEPSCVRGCRGFMTKKGYIGGASDNIRKGDVVCVILGVDLPLILRPRTNAIEMTVYEMISACYVHGIMDGEALRDVDLDQLGYLNLV